jgi:antitoxin VapB
MGTQLNIKNAEAHRFAVELSDLTGESLTEAVTAALRERLLRERARRERIARADRLMAIAADFRAHMPPPLPSSDHSDLYDEDGLPA